MFLGFRQSRRSPPRESHRADRGNLVFHQIDSHIPCLNHFPCRWAGRLFRSFRSLALT